MKTIATLTLNPALDITTGTLIVRPTEKLRCSAPRRDPGGGGINVARVVQVLGGQSLAIFPVGGPVGDMLTQELARMGLACRSVPIAGKTRESFTVNEDETGDQYRFSLPGPELSVPERQACLDRLSSLEEKPAMVVASGSLPPGVPPDVYRDLAELCRTLGARLILDISVPAFAGMKDIGAFLLKVNRIELGLLVGRDIVTPKQDVAAARELIALGFVEVVVISLGDEGALLVAADEEERFPAIDVPVSSAVGAGDSMVAAIALFCVEGRSLRAAVRAGLAAGAAAVMTPGTELVRRQDFERLLQAMEDGDGRE